MSLINLLNSGAAGNVVQVPSVFSFYRSAPTGPVYSGAKFDADGSLYVRTTFGEWQVSATWLLGGTNSTFYLSRVINSGTLTNDAGAGPLQMNTDREYEKIRNFGYVSVSVTFNISDDVSGSPVVAMGTYLFECEVGQV